MSTWNTSVECSHCSTTHLDTPIIETEINSTIDTLPNLNLKISKQDSLDIQNATHKMIYHWKILYNMD